MEKRKSLRGPVKARAPIIPKKTAKTAICAIRRRVREFIAHILSHSFFSDFLPDRPLQLLLQIDQFVILLLAPLALWVLVSGLDDLVLDVACFVAWLSGRISKARRFPWPDEGELDRIPQKRIAIFVPLWR